MSISQYPSSSGGSASVAGAYIGTIGVNNYGFTSGMYEFTFSGNNRNVLKKAMTYGGSNAYYNLDSGDFSQGDYYLSASGNFSSLGDFSSETIVSPNTSFQLVQYPTASGAQFPANIQYDYAISNNAGPRKFVSLASSGSYSTSPNGLQWTDRGYLPTSYSTQFAISYINGNFVSIGQQGKGAFSQDGITWTSFTIGDTSQSIYNRPVYLNGKYFILGSGAVFSSSDLTSWTKTTVQYVSSNGSQLTFGNGVYVLTSGPEASYRTYSSTDGVTWTEISQITQGNSNDSPRGVAYSASPILSGFYAVAKTKLWHSADGTSWTEKEIVNGVNIYRRVQILDDRILINSTGDSRSIYQSKDGVSWKKLGKTFGNQKGNDIQKDGDTYYLSINSSWLVKTTELFKAAQPFVINVFKSNDKDLSL